MESGLRPGAAQLENRQRWFGLRLPRLPQGDQAREIDCRRPDSHRAEAHECPRIRGQKGAHIPLEEPETLDAELVQEEEAEARAEAEKARPGLTMVTDGSRLDDGATGYAVVWRKGQSWAGIKTHMGYNQEARRYGYWEYREARENEGDLMIH